MASAENVKLVAQLRAASLMREGTIAEQRERMERATENVPMPTRVRAEPASGPGFVGQWFRIGPPSLACVLYLHGGGFMLGSTRSHRPLLGNFVNESKVDFLAIDYRLAPEHPYPAAIEDTLAAYRWLLGQGYPPARIAIAGDSAGASLALSAMMRMRDEGLPLPACGLLLCGWYDLTLSGDSWRRNSAADPMVNVAMVKEMTALYLGNVSPTDPIASPAFGDFARLPPLFVQAGTADILEDDSHLCVRRAREAGVAANLDLWVDMIHVWQFYSHVIPEASAAIVKAESFLTSHVS